MHVSNMYSRASIARDAAHRGLTSCAHHAAYTSNKLTLSLVHQANLIVIKEISPTRIGVWDGSFTVWSGVTANSTLEYNLTEYLDKLDYAEYNVKAKKH